MSDTLHIFIGYDHRETIAYHVLAHSIMSRATMPVAIHPIKSSLFSEFYKRPRDAKQSNDFSFTRFLVPHLMGHNGWALFMDCDMLMQTDIRELWEMRDTSKAIMVCKHDYVPRSAKKYLGQTQYPYPRKNWSSFMLMNCNNWSCHHLTPQFVANASGLELHQFKWCPDDRIGEIPLEWNWLVGEYDKREMPKNIHFTIGGPWDKAFSSCDYAELWQSELNNMLYADSTIENQAV